MPQSAWVRTFQWNHLVLTLEIMKLNARFGTGSPLPLFTDTIKVPISFSIIRNQTRFEQIIVRLCHLQQNLGYLFIWLTSIICVGTNFHGYFLTRSVSHSESGLLLLQSLFLLRKRFFIGLFEAAISPVSVGLLLRSLDSASVSAGTSYNGRLGLYCCVSQLLSSSMHFQQSQNWGEI